MKARRVATAPFRGLKALGSMLFSRQSGLVWRFLPRTRFNYAREVGDGLGSSLIMAPLLWMARTFPESPPQVLDAEGAPVEPHAMVLKLRRPNPFYSGIVLWMATLLSWVVDGNAYWVKIRDGNGGVAELWYVPHWMIEPKSDSTTELVTHYEYRPDGRPIKLDVNDVVHFRYGLDPRDVRRGLSPLGSVLREVFTDDEAANFSAALLKNLGVPGLMVSPKTADQQPGPDDVAATKDYLREETTGDRRGEPLVMSGPTDVAQFGFSPEQLTLKELRRVPEERVTAVIGLPAIVCGLGAGLDRSTFANYGEAREAAWEDNIIPSQRMFGEELRHQLLPDFEDRPEQFEVGWDRSGVRVLQEDRNKEALRLGQLYRDGLITRKEGREDLGKEVADADDVFAVPFSTVLLPAGELPPAPTGSDSDPPTEEGESQTSGRKQETREQTRLVVALERDERALAAAFAEELEADFAELGELAADAFGAVVNEADLASRSNGHLKADDETLAQRVVGALSISGWTDGRLRARFEAHSKRTSRRTLETINTVLELGLQLSEPSETRLIREGGSRRGLVDVATSTREAIARAIAAGREAGDNPIAIARRIRDEVPAGRYANAGAAYRSQLIARTETKWAQNHSSLAIYRDAETVSSVIAFDARLGESDADCMARNGQTYTFDEAEAELANEHPNGTLSFAPVVAETVSELEGATA